MANRGGVYSIDDLWKMLDECRTVLRALAEYTGGSDAPPGHPARDAWDYIKSLESREI